MPTTPCRNDCPHYARILEVDTSRVACIVDNQVYHNIKSTTFVVATHWTSSSCSSYELPTMQMLHCKKHFVSNVERAPSTLPSCQKVMACHMTTAAQQGLARVTPAASASTKALNKKTGLQSIASSSVRLEASCGVPQSDQLVHKLVRELVGSTSLLM